MRILFKLFVIYCCLAGMISRAQAQVRPVVATIAIPPVNPFIRSAFASPVNGINVLVRNLSDTGGNIRIIGKLQRVSSPGFVLEKTIQDVGTVPPNIPLGPRGMYSLTNSDLDDAFGHFDGLQVTGISLNSIRDDSTGAIKLPPGQYRICFTALTFRFNQQYVAEPNPGCAFFSICKIDPPQFTRPSSNFSVGSNMTVIQDASPVNFTWTPPLTACGSPGPITYELEIRDLFDNQYVTDAINNPVIFYKTGIPSPAFLLDLRVYPNILKPGKRYVVRTRATPVNIASPVTIDNNGYSRPEAFQFGSENALTPTAGWNASSYYLPFEERKSNLWSDYERRGGKDTLVPVAEYIAYKLMQQGVAYSQDAIELLVAYNPMLKDVKTVKLKQPAELPGFPDITDKDRRQFESAYAVDMQPDNGETARFRQYLDSLNKSGYKQKMPERASLEITDLIGHLERFAESASTTNGVSLSFINASLSELLFEIRSLQNGLSGKTLNHLHDIIDDVKALAVVTSSGSSPHASNQHPDYIHWASYKDYTPEPEPRERDKKYFALEPLIPVDVIVYRPTVPPANAIMNAPDLKGVYRVFYTSRTLYNNKNPEINAKSPGPLASTTRVSLPGYLKYKFWTLNMINHKLTLPQDIDVLEIASNSQKEGVKGKKITVVLKVE